MPGYFLRIELLEIKIKLKLCPNDEGGRSKFLLKGAKAALFTVLCENLAILDDQ